jgi:hypothetical protein
MSRYQYRYHGRAQWQSQAGNALVALQNKLGSGKKILVHSVEATPITRGVSTVLPSTLQIIRSTAIRDGEVLPLAKCDSSATLPSGISLQRNAVLYPSRMSTFCGARFGGWHAAAGVWVTVDESNYIWTSSNGIDWEPGGSFGGTAVAGCYSSTLELALLFGNSGALMSSDDASTWTSRTSGVAVNLRGGAWSAGLGLFVVVGDSGTIITSSDGESWTPQTSGSVNQLYSAAWSPTLNLFVVCGGNGTILTSTNGTSWTDESTGTTDFFQSVIWSTTLGAFVVAGSDLMGTNGLILTSTSGASWTVQLSGVNSVFSDVADATDWSKVVAVSNDGSRGGVYESTNGTQWIRKIGPVINIKYVGYSADIEQLLCVSDSSTALTNDGTNWISLQQPLRSSRSFHQASSSRATLGATIGPAGAYSMDTALFSHRNFGGDTEPLILRPGEALAVVYWALSTTAGASRTVRADVTFVVDGTPKRTYAWSGLVWPESETGCPLAIVNNSASDVVRVKSLRIHDAGSTDSPYFRLVPIGAINPDTLSDSLARLPVVKLDSAAPDLAESIAVLVADAPIQPYGVPEAYIADSSAGAPKGVNYLQTKDFVGPQYAVVFGEYTGTANINTRSDAALAGLSPRGSQMKGFQAPIVVREGEAVGLVSSAELATAASAVGCTGWSTWDIGITFSVEPIIVPTITVIVKDINNTSIANVSVLLTANTGGYMPYRSTVTIVNSGTTATVTHSNHGLLTGDKVLIKNASHYQNNGVFTIVKITNNSYSYVMSSAPGSNPTGTILCTGVILEGTTNINGTLSITRDINSSQPAIGWARKSSGVPYYKSSIISGIISASSDTTLSVLLLSDG